ncbi:MAG: methyl-accepting chemotaxis protein [Planctomycetota bacterium]
MNRHAAADPAATQPAASLDPLGSLESLRALVDRMQANVLVADLDLRLVHMNPRAIEHLRRVEDAIIEAFDVRVDEMIGLSIHQFHRDARRVERILRDPRSLPHEATFAFGDVVFRSRINDIRCPDLCGYVVSWEDVTEEMRTLSEMTRVRNMVQSAPTNIMFADLGFKIRFMNPQMVATLRKVESSLPVGVDAMIGTSIDVFHREPERQRRLLADPRNLPHSVQIQIGSDHFGLLVSAIHDQEGTYIGAMVTWEHLTEKVLAEQRAQELTEAITASSARVASAAEEFSATSEQLSTTAEETSAQSEAAASGAEQVSKSVESVSTGVEEMTASIREIAKSATEAARVAASAVEMAQSANATMLSLDQSSGEIGNVVRVITSIAQQTKLLALNATIEAARAGEAGKGFAVVANEVKELAKETASATEDIGRQVTAIQASTQGAVADLGRITEIIDQISDLQNTIATAVEEQSATSNQITRNLSEAARATGDIAQNVGGVAAAAAQTSSGAGTTLRSAQELAALADDLRKLVERFSK